MALPDNTTKINSLLTAINNLPSVSGVDPESYTYSQINSYAKDYLDNVTYDPSDYSTSEIETYCGAVSGVRKDRPLGCSIPVSAGTLSVSDTKAGTVFNKSVSTGSTTIENVTPGTSSGAYIVSNNGNVSECGMLTPTGSLRMINGGGNTFNIRDLGGWAADGGVLAYGKIFRGGELNGDTYGVTLTEDQVVYFRDVLGIRDEIDLRGDSEVDGDDGIVGTLDDITESALGSDIDYVRYPIAAYANGVNLAAQVQSEYYRNILKRVAEDLATDGGKPIYLHCLAGADRTGTVCALIEAICGVAQNDIDRDYELTSFSPSNPTTGTGTNLRRRTSSDWTGLITRINSFTGSTFRDKVVNYALQIGVSIEEINTIRKELIDGSPSDLTSPFNNATVSRTLTDVTSTNTNNSTILYQPYETYLIPITNYTLTNASITMGGSDISSDAISLMVDGSIDIAANNHKAHIYIPKVTGNLALLAGASAGARLPSAYQEVDWIASDGNETIQVELSSAGTVGACIIYTGLMRTDSGVRGLMGCANTGADTIGAAAGTYFGWRQADGLYELGGSGTSISAVTSSTTTFDKLKFEFYQNYSGKLYKWENDAWTQIAYRSGTSGSYTKWNVCGGTNYKVSGKFKEVEVYNSTNGATLTAHLVPCYRKSDSFVCMYDLVAGDICVKLGSGNFTKGNDV